MEQLSQLRMQNHELTMGQMVEEIYRGLLNIGQAAAKFEVNRKTVKHWLDKVKQEVALAGLFPEGTGVLCYPQRRLLP